MQLIHKAEETNNKNQLLALYVKCALYINRVDIEECMKYMNKVLYSISRNEVHNANAPISLMNLANVALYLCDYKLMESCIKKAMTYHSHFLYERNVVCLCFCAHMLDEKIEDVYFKEIISHPCDKLDLALYHFYEGYEERTTYQNIKYITKKLSSLITEYDTLYKEILGKELKLLCNKTKHYKYYIEYMDKHNL